MIKKFEDYLSVEYDKQAAKFKIDSNVKNVLDTADIVLNFNYTNTLQDVYGIESSKEIHVHGDFTASMILGHSNYYDGEGAKNFGVHFTDLYEDVSIKISVNELNEEGIYRFYQKYTFYDFDRAADVYIKMLKRKLIDWNLIKLSVYLSRKKGGKSNGYKNWKIK